MISCIASGKTTQLLTKLNTYSIANLKCLYVNSVLDTRGEVFSTHNPLLTSIGHISSAKLTILSEYDYSDYDVIGIDEAGFFPDLKDVVLDLVERQKKRVLVAGLTADYLRRPLGQTLDLIPYADTITKLSSVCKWCAQKREMREASFSHRIVQSDQVILIGLQESYVPLCRECYLSTR